MSEIRLRLRRRYPHSRPEDITDAYMRGVEEGRRIAGKDANRLRKLVSDMHATLKHEDKPCRLYGLHEKVEGYEGRMRALGIEVDA